MCRVALGLLLITTGVTAQSTRAELALRIVDLSGRSVGAAEVVLTLEDTGDQRSAITPENGSVRFFALSPGTYRILVRRDGFARLERRGVMLEVGQQAELELMLTPGAVNESITVTADAPLLETTRGTASFSVDRKRVTSLPLDGRNFVQLLALSPGVTLPRDSSFPRFNGSRPRTSEYIYDGISVLQPEPGQVPFYPIVDAIEEFRVETNSPSAEYGRTNGGVIMVRQRSGTNEFHGSLFHFFRNEALNARNLFARSTDDKPRFRRNQYGFVFGGPVRRNRTFFFTAWQGTRLDTGVVRVSTVPTLEQRDGRFDGPVFDPLTTALSDSGYVRMPFDQNRIPVSRIDPLALAALNRYPEPTSAGRANNYRRVGNNRTAQDQFDVRLDHTLNPSQRTFVRYSHFRDDSVPVTPLPDGSGNIGSGILSPSLTRGDSLAAEHSWTVTPAAVNQLRFGYTQRSLDRDAIGGPIYSIAGAQQLGPPQNAIGRIQTSVTQWVDNFSWLVGAHSLKMGADVRLEHLNALQPPVPQGQFDFTSILTSGLAADGTPLPSTGNSFASFLTGQVESYRVDIQPETLRPRASIAELFLQDDWRATSRLSVNAGLRYTLNFPSTVVGDRGAVFNLNTQQLDYLGQSGFPRSARNLDKTGFGPRLGLAFRVAPGTVVRAGYSLTWIEMAGITTPFTTPLFPFIRTHSQQTLDNIHPAFVLADGPAAAPQSLTPDAGLGQGVFAVQRDNGSGYAQQWNLTIQKTFGTAWRIEVGYLGSKLTRLGVPDINLNQLTVEQLALGSALTEQVANPFYGEIPANSSLGQPTISRAQLLKPYPRFTAVTLYRNNIGHSTYHSFQAGLERRLSQGLVFSAAYTYSRLIDDAGAVFNAAVLTGPVMNYNAADSHNKRLEKDVSTGNIPHTFSAGLVYDLPFGGRDVWGTLGRGWQIAAIARLQAGSPLAVTQAANFNAFAGFGIQRPNRVADPALSGDQQTLNRWFDTQAFQQAPQFSLGSSSRNPVVGPGYRTLDVMIGRTFVVTERMRLEFRAEAFNVTNTPPLGNPNTTFGTPGFGSITSAGDPRVFELVGKLHF